MKLVCLVTGAAGKLGTALCSELLKQYDCVAVYHQRVPTFPSQLLRPLDIIRAIDHGGEAFCIQGDLTKQEDIRRIVEVALARFGRIDHIINSAADVRFHGPLLDLAYGSGPVASQLFLNCVAPFELISAIFQAFWKDERHLNAEFNRCVVNVSSASGSHVYKIRGQAFYAGSKAALNHLTRYLAAELAVYSVRSNAICPARFPDSIPTHEVVLAIKTLLESNRTGDVIDLAGA